MYSKAQRRRTLKLLPLLLLTTNAATAHTIAGIFPKGDKPNGVLFSALTIVALFVALAIHELGHLIAGLIQGFRFQMFIVGLLGIKRTANAIKIYLNKNVGYMGGIASTVPVSHRSNNKKKFAIIMASGPIASFMFSISSFLLFSFSTSGVARGFWFIEGFSSIAVFLATTLPFKSGVFFTDRARFQRLMSKGSAGENEEALLTIVSCRMKENCCKNIPLAKAKMLQSDTDSLMRFWGHYYEYCYFKDNGMQSEVETAGRTLYSIKDTIPPHLWKSLHIENTNAHIKDQKAQVG
jgi:hypothetical protein